MSLDLCFDQKKKETKGWKGWRCFFVCAISFACSACCLWRTFQNVSFWSRAAIFIYQRIPERMSVQVNLPNASLHFRLYKGKKTPLLRKHSKCSAPQRCYFYLFLFIFVYLINIWYGILPSIKISLRAFFAFNLVKCWCSLVSNLYMCVCLFFVI